MSKIRREVLNAFKKLHRTRQYVFQEDDRALIAGRNMINDNFRKNKDATDEVEIKQMVQLAHDVDKELRTNVIQAVQKTPSVYHLRITEEITRMDNVVFNPDAVIEPPRRRRAADRNDAGCCGGATPATPSASDKVVQQK